VIPLLGEAHGPFRVYRNLHKKCWSVQHKTPQGWRLLAHMQSLACANVTFSVSEAGRQRVLSSGRKNVHAYVCTDDISYTEGVGDNSHIDGWEEITYDPRKHEGFIALTDNRPIHRARAVFLTSEGRAFAHNID
jgi:hypothetical protein